MMIMRPPQHGHGRGKHRTRIHVLPKGFHRIRHYGLLASGNRAANIALARELLAVPPRYDWDTFFVAIARRIYDNGLPKTQGELVREMLDWFQARHEDHTPDESTVRRKVAMVWRELKRA
jgi:hypothetical protein